MAKDGQPSSELLRAEFSPGFSSLEAISARLALPDVLTTGAGDRLRGMLLLERLPTNWTIFAPHIHACLFPNEGVCYQDHFKRPEFACLFQLEQEAIRFFV